MKKLKSLVRKELGLSLDTIDFVFNNGLSNRGMTIFLPE